MVVVCVVSLAAGLLRRVLGLVLSCSWEYSGGSAATQSGNLVFSLCLWVGPSPPVAWVRRWLYLCGGASRRPQAAAPRWHRREERKKKRRGKEQNRRGGGGKLKKRNMAGPPGPPPAGAPWRGCKVEVLRLRQRLSTSRQGAPAGPSGAGRRFFNFVFSPLAFPKGPSGRPKHL